MRLIVGILFLFSAANIVHAEEAHEGLTFSALGGFSFESQSNSVDSGFASNLGIKNGTLYGAQLFWQIKESAHGIGLRYKHQSTQYSGLSSLSPSAVELNHDTFEIYSYWKPYFEDESLSRLQLGLALSLNTTTSEITSPNAVFIPNNMFGLKLLSRWTSKLAGEFGYEVNLDLGVPFFFQEKKADSGRHIYSFDVGSSITFTYPVSEMVDIALGFMFTVEKSAFEGVGSNGSVNLKHTQTQFGFPAEVRFKF